MNSPENKNLLSDLPTALSEELTEVLAKNQQVRIERIVSTGQVSPAGFWYDQEEFEWILVLKGAAKLLFEGDDEPITMRAGDHLLIQPHRKHRVIWTMPDEPTVWLAVFYGNE